MLGEGKIDRWQRLRKGCCRVVCGEGKIKSPVGGAASFVFLTLAGEGRRRENAAAGDG